MPRQDELEWVPQSPIRINNSMHIDVETQGDRWLLVGVLHQAGNASRVMRTWEYVRMKPERRSHWRPAFEEAEQELTRQMRQDTMEAARRTFEQVPDHPGLRDYQRHMMRQIEGAVTGRWRPGWDVTPPPSAEYLKLPLRFQVRSEEVSTATARLQQSLQAASMSMADLARFQELLATRTADFRQIEERIITSMTPDEIDTMIYATIGAKAMQHVFPKDMELSTWAPGTFEHEGFQAFKIRTIEAAEAEGQKMKHCMGNMYLDKMARGMHLAYHVDSPYNKRGLTIGFNAYRMKWTTMRGQRRLVPIREGEPGSWKLYQIVGAANSTPKEPERAKRFAQAMERFINDAWRAKPEVRELTLDKDRLFGLTLPRQEGKSVKIATG
jgi:hypothetical protein